MTHCHKDFFHEKGFKNTPIRDRVLHTLGTKALTAEDVYQILFLAGEKMAFSTIYRVLEQFSDVGITERVYLDHENKTRYQQKRDLHHGHTHELICTKCHEVIVLEECPVDQLTADIAKKNQFKVDHHQLRFYGLCHHCQA